MAEEPVLGHGEARVFVEGLGKNLCVPEGNGAMREGGRSNFPGKLALDATEFVLKVLSSMSSQSLVRTGVMGCSTYC
jgi:hypothetical protein